MNIIIFTQEDPFYVKVFFDEFFGAFKTPEEVRALIISKPMGKKSVRKLAGQMYELYGLRDFIRMGVRYGFRTLMSKRPIPKAENGIPPKTYSVRNVAEVYGIPVLEWNDLNNKEFRKLIKSYDPDLCISVASPIIFKEELIKIPKLDCINIHHAPLPKYRGMLPSFWQLYHEEKQAGITIHRIDKGVDTGDIIVQHFLPIYSEESLDELILRTKKESAKIMVKVIDSFRKGEVRYKKMEGKGSYFTFPNREDVREFKRIGKRLL